MLSSNASRLLAACKMFPCNNLSKDHKRVTFHLKVDLSTASMLIIIQEDWLDFMWINLQTDLTSLPVHQSIVPYVQINSREVLRRQQHSLCSEASITAGSELSLLKYLHQCPRLPSSSVASKWGCLPTRVILLIQLMGKSGVVVRGLKICKPSFEASQLPERWWKAHSPGATLDTLLESI